MIRNNEIFGHKKFVIFWEIITNLKLENLGYSNYVPKPNVQNQIDFFVAALNASFLEIIGKFEIDELFQRALTVKKDIIPELNKLDLLSKKKNNELSEFYKNLVL